LSKQATGINSVNSEAITKRELYEPRFRITNYALLLKPRVMSLVVFTAAAGMFLAPGGIASIEPITAFIAIICIAIGAGASGAINMWYDRDIDLHMLRTRNRPLPAGRLQPFEALVFGILLAFGSVLAMAWWVNFMSSMLLALTIIFYVFIYTVWLKRRTPYNIVIGGASGALPPTIGWATVTDDVGLGSFLLFAIIFLWTPPHTWALALFRRGDYESAGVPMLPVVAGERNTKLQMIYYTVLLIPVSLLPVLLGMSGLIYGITAIVLGFGFASHVWRVWKDKQPDGGKTARPMFFFTLLYLFLIFVGLLADRVFFLTIF
jgi:protoheme IX farnesyltransferase